MGQPEVRALGAGDLDGLLRLYEQLHPNDTSVARAELESTWRTILGQPWLHHVGVFVDGVLASACHAAIVPNLTRGAKPYAVLEAVVTDRAHRRSGLGALAMRTLIQRCWDAGCYKVSLTSNVSREPAHAFYLRLGFDLHAKHAFVLVREP